MKRRSFLHVAGAAGFGGLSAVSCGRGGRESGDGRLVRFIHFSDVHVQPERGATEGFRAAIAAMNGVEGAELAIGGGDLIMDALAVDETRATMLYDLYDDCCADFAMPVHHTLGNHEVFGIYDPSKVREDHPLRGKEMFRRRLGGGRTWRAFDHGGVRFHLLDSVGILPNDDKPGHRYVGEIGPEQLAWVRDDIAGLAPGTPVVAVSHIPLFTLYSQLSGGPTAASHEGIVIRDGLALMDAYGDANLVGFMQGHIHINELYTYLGTSYIDTGAVCGEWWGGARLGSHPEGFNVVDVYPGRVVAEYRTYGWDASKYS